MKLKKLVVFLLVGTLLLSLCAPIAMAVGSASPNTGDESPLTVWIIVLAVSLAGILGLIIYALVKKFGYKGKHTKKDE